MPPLGFYKTESENTDMNEDKPGRWLVNEPVRSSSDSLRVRSGHDGSHVKVRESGQECVWSACGETAL